MKQNKIKQPVLAVLSAAFLSVLTACGGDASVPSQGVVATREGQFVDSPVQGLRYDAGSGVTGVTDAQGKFRYIPGQDVRFFIGNTVFGTALGSEIITPATLAKMDNANNGINSPALINRLRLLQALDTDGDPRTLISLPANINLPGTSALNFAVDATNFVLEPVVGSLLGLLGTSVAALPSQVQALAHFEGYALKNLFQGCYLGNIRDMGEVVLKVSESGAITGKAPLTAGGSAVPVTGTMRGDGSFSFGPAGALNSFVGSAVPLKGQSVGGVSYETLGKQGGLLSRDPKEFPSFDVSKCAQL